LPWEKKKKKKTLALQLPHIIVLKFGLPSPCHTPRLNITKGPSFYQRLPLRAFIEFSSLSHSTRARAPDFHQPRYQTTQTDPAITSQKPFGIMPSKDWDEEDSDSSSPASPPPATAVRRRQFDDEEDDSDVLEDWDDAEDSEVEREKQKKAAEAKAKADAEAAANKKSKAERIAERQASRAKAALEDDEEEEEETEAERRERLRRTEQEADLKHAEDLLGDFGNIGISNTRKAKAPGTVISVDGNNTVDIATLPLFNPSTKAQFEQLRTTLVPILTASSKKAHYVLFLQELAKQLAADLPSDQVKKVSSALTALSNEKMKAEKAADKGGKKTKAAKTKTTLVASRANTVDTNTYEDDAFGDDDFM
jgi:translation initiation factor 3 subunit J